MGFYEKEVAVEELFFERVDWYVEQKKNLAQQEEEELGMHPVPFLPTQHCPA